MRDSYIAHEKYVCHLVIRSDGIDEWNEGIAMNHHGRNLEKTGVNDTAVGVFSKLEFKNKTPQLQ